MIACMRAFVRPEEAAHTLIYVCAGQATPKQCSAAHPHLPPCNLFDVLLCACNACVLCMQDVTLNIKGRSRVALLGKNGAGKSTLMQLLCGTLAPNKPPAGFVPPEASTPASAVPLTKKQAKAARGMAVNASALPSARAAVAASAAAATAGSIERPAGLRVGLFGQHCMDALQVPESALQHLTGVFVCLCKCFCVSVF